MVIALAEIRLRFFELVGIIDLFLFNFKYEKFKIWSRQEMIFWKPNKRELTIYLKS